MIVVREGVRPHVGPFMGIEPTGKQVSGREMFFCLERGKIAEGWRMDEVEGFAAQLER